MRFLLPVLLLLLAGCGTAPKPEVGAEWVARTQGGSMYLPSEVTMVYDYEAVQVGDICAYYAMGRRVIHRVIAEPHPGIFVMKGDFNLERDRTYMTQGNYLGTMVQ